MLLSVAVSANGAPLIVESFESGDMSATNKDGFNWERNNRTSVVTADAKVYENGSTYSPPASGKNWSAFHGNHSLRFRYPAGEAWSEQRFDLGGSYPEIWIQYWVRVPTNYSHGTSSPSNHKFLALWMDGYSSKGAGPTIAWEFWGSGGGSSSLAFHYSEGNYELMGGHKQFTDFISVPRDRGRWMEITIHAKASSRGRSSDGVIELWRRWEGESSDNRERLHRITDAVLPYPSNGPNGWAAGYLMGWANAAYSQETEWLIDHITISTDSLLNSAGVTEKGNAPNPPELEIRD